MAKEPKNAEPASNFPNEFQERALWLRSLADKLRPEFTQAGLPLPEQIRYGFTTRGGNTKRVGECWHSPASADGTYEIFIRADQEDPMEIATILVAQLIHAALPVDDSHGKKYRTAAHRMQLEGSMRSPVAGQFLKPRLQTLLDDLGPLPHRTLDLTWSAFDKPKPQTGRMLKAVCAGSNDDQGKFVECGYAVRIASKWAKEYGVHCPKHGPIAVEFPADDEAPESDDAATFDAAAPAPDQHHDTGSPEVAHHV